MKKSILLVFLAVLMLVCGCSQGTVNNEGRRIAVTVGKNEIDEVEMLYQYKESISDFYNKNYQLVSMLGIDFTGDLSQAKISDTQTWQDYFIESAMYVVMEENYLMLAAEETGFELSEKQLSDVEKSLSDFYSQLSAYGYDTETYLKENYGANITVADFEKYVMNDAIVFYYYQELISQIPVDDAALTAYYEANSKNFDSVDFKIYHFAYTVPETTEEGSEEPADESYKLEAKTLAETALANITSPEDFDDQIKALLGAEAVASWKDGYTDATAQYSEIFTELADWLFDAGRAYGDKTILEYNNGYFVVVYENRYLDSYNTVDVRHCLVATNTVSNILVEGSDEIDYEATQAAQAASDAEAYAKAEKLLNDWIAGGATEEEFIAMANANSDDDGAVDGLYTQVVKGEMVEEFEDWCFDKSRVVGDYGIVKTIYGYHIMYFSAVNEPVWKLTAKDAIRNTEYEKLYESYAEKYPVIRNKDVLKNIK